MTQVSWSQVDWVLHHQASTALKFIRLLSRAFLIISRNASFMFAAPEPGCELREVFQSPASARHPG